MRLKDIQAVLGCSKATASLLKNGKYQCNSMLPEQYAALIAFADKTNTTAICAQCPRSDCTGCRIMEMTNGL